MARKNRGARTGVQNIVDDFAGWLSTSSNTYLGIALIATAAVIFIALSLFYEDYSTSLRGYEMLPTAKANLWIIPIIALLPQVLQTAFGLVWVRNRNLWAAAVVTLAFVADTATDIYFKASGCGFSISCIGIATVESFLLFTLGSEFLLTAGLTAFIGIAKELWDGG